MKHIHEYVQDIGIWGDRTFNHHADKVHSTTACIEHLRREANELQEAGSVEELGEECADIFILMCSVCHINRIDLEAFIVEKMNRNKKRQWGKPDAHGVIEHIPVETAESEAK